MFSSPVDSHLVWYGCQLGKQLYLIVSKHRTRIKAIENRFFKLLWIMDVIFSTRIPKYCDLQYQNPQMLWPSIPESPNIATFSTRIPKCCDLQYQNPQMLWPSVPESPNVVTFSTRIPKYCDLQYQNPQMFWSSVPNVVNYGCDFQPRSYGGVPHRNWRVTKVEISNVQTRKLFFTVLYPMPGSLGDLGPRCLPV